MDASKRAVRLVATPEGSPTEFALEDVTLSSPGHGHVQVQVRAAGLNPADLGVLAGGPPRRQAQPMGFECAGLVVAVGPGASTEERPVAVGDEVVIYLMLGSFASMVDVPAVDVFAKPPNLGFAAAANLFLVGLTAAEMLEVTRVTRGDTIVVHGASGATVVSVLQQARLLGARVIGTSSELNFELLRSFGAEPVTYGAGLEDRLRELAPTGVDAALDCVGSEEALVTSTVLVADRSRMVSIANSTRAAELGIRYIVGSDPTSYEYRNSQRKRVLQLAARGDLAVPVARTFPLAEQSRRSSCSGQGTPEASWRSSRDSSAQDLLAARRSGPGSVPELRVRVFG